MEEAPENDKESLNSAHANGMNEWKNEWMISEQLVTKFMVSTRDDLDCGLLNRNLLPLSSDSNMNAEGSF
jgi:hypothetical protein